MVVDATVPMTLMLTGGSVAVVLGRVLPGYLTRPRPTARQTLAAAMRTLHCRHVELIDEPPLHAVRPF